MSDSLESNPIPVPIKTEAPKVPVFGQDTIASLKPKTPAQLEAEAKSGWDHGPSLPSSVESQAQTSPSEDLVLSLQDIPPLTPAGAPTTESRQPQQRIYDQPLKPGDPLKIRRGQVLFDAEGREMGISDNDTSGYVLDGIIRNPNKAPLFALRSPDGKLVYTKKIGSSWVMGSRE